MTNIWPKDMFNPTEEHKFFRNSLRKFVEKEIEPGAALRDQKEQFDNELFTKLGSLGLLGITVSSEYGGAGMDAVYAVIAHEEISFSDPGFCLSYLAHTILTVNNIYKNASHEQKKLYLPNLISGKWIGAMAMSETSAGTDVLGMKTRAQIKEDVVIINGQKMWITNGAKDNDGNIADIIFLYAKTDKDSKKVSSFIIPYGAKGAYVGQVLKHKLGMRSSLTAELLFENCEIKNSNIIGNIGDSVKHMMRNLEIERLCLAAMSLGIAKRAIKIMVSYAKERNAFGRPINKFGQIQKYIADSYAKYMACASFVYKCAFSLDLSKDENNRLDSDAAKLICSTVAKEICDNAIQVLGGNGYMGEYVVERLWRDAKLMEIGGGTIEAHQKNITKDLIAKI